MRRILSVAVAFVAAVILVAIPSGAVSAQSSNGLGITPRKDIVVEPGKSVTDEVLVSNLNNSQDLKLELQVIDFGAKDETGTPALELDTEARQTAWSLRPFITAPKTLSVGPGKTEKVRFTINIPAAQGAGSYYSAIRYVAQGSDSGQVAISASGATLVFVAVPGKTKESLVLQQFGAYDSSGSGSFKSLFVKEPPLELAYRLKNQGNVAEQPSGAIEIKNMFGKQVQVIKDANPKASLALIDQIRLFTACVNQPDRNDDSQDCKKVSLMPGRYSANLSLFYGINGNQTQEVVASASFWYLPVWFLVLIGIVVLAITGVAFFLYRKFTGKHGFKRR